MSLGEDVQAVLPFLRAQAESTMTSTCTVTRASGNQVYNPDTGGYEAAQVTVYPTAEHIAAGNLGKCRVQTVRAQAANPESGTAVFTVERVELQLPFGTKFQHDDVATITAEPLNPDLVGTKYRVTGLGRKSQATAQRLNVEVVT